MKIARILGFICLAVFASSSTARATIIMSENFDSYSDTAAMSTVWTGTVGTLSNTLSYSPSNSAAHPGGAVRTYAPGIGTAAPTATQNLVLTAKIYDDALVANDRMSVGLRTGTAPLFEIGRYNDFTPYTGTHTYGIRGVTLGNGITSPGYVPFRTGALASIPATVGWHTYQATFSIVDGLTVTLDLNSNGSIDSTIQFTGNGTSAFNSFNQLRFGGLSGVSSGGGGANFDDISLAMVDIVPEPASLLMIGLLGLSLSCVRTRS
jgi:hypothetical protein